MQATKHQKEEGKCHPTTHSLPGRLHVGGVDGQGLSGGVGGGGEVGDNGEGLLQSGVLLEDLRAALPLLG